MTNQPEIKDTQYTRLSKRKLDKLKIDLIGQTFGRLTITDMTRFNGIQGAMCMAICECGKVKEYRLISLKKNMTSSCGCYNKESHSTHGLCKSPLYRTWAGIKRRCYCPQNHNYHLYGAIGVVMSEDWLNDFKLFHDWCMLNGWEKGLQVDRFPNKTGNYCPENCRISTPKQNSNNKTNNRLMNISGIVMTMAEAVEKYSIKTSTLLNRLNRGMSDYDATHISVRPKRKPIKYQPTLH